MGSEKYGGSEKEEGGGGAQRRWRHCIRDHIGAVGRTHETDKSRMD